MQSVLHTSVCANVYTRCQSLAFNVWIAKFQNIASGFSRMCLCATDAKCLATIMNNNSFRILETSFCTQIKLSLNFFLSKNTSSHTHTHPNTFYAFSLGAFAVEPINDNFTVKFFVHFKLKICSLSGVSLLQVPEQVHIIFEFHEAILALDPPTNATDNTVN